MISVSAGNQCEFLYHKNYNNNKYEIIGLRFYKFNEEDGSCIAKIDDIDALISAAQSLKRDLKEFNDQ